MATVASCLFLAVLAVAVVSFGEFVEFIDVVVSRKLGGK